jgi:hypothetical protein
MAAAHWQLMRIWARERAHMAHDIAPLEKDGTDRTHIGTQIDDPPTRDAIAFGKSNGQRSEYEMRCDRQFTRALDRFQKFVPPDPSKCFNLKTRARNLNPFEPI